MNGKRLIILLLLVVSALLYWLQFVLYQRPADTQFYLLQDLAFLPINVILVTLGVDTLVRWRQRQDKLKNINLLVSEYFSESGAELITKLNSFVANLAEVQAKAGLNNNCTDKEFRASLKTLEAMDVKLFAKQENLEELAALLDMHKANLLALFQNPNLLEHDRFTDMLWAVYHLADELKSRNLSSLPQADLMHISLDMKRAYVLLVIEWVYITRHMSKRYPYLYKAVSRKSPFSINTNTD